MVIQCELLIISTSYLLVLIVSVQIFKRTKQKPAIIGFWLIVVSGHIKKGLAFGLQSSRSCKTFPRHEIPSTWLHVLVSQVSWPSDLEFKREIQKGTLPHMLIRHNSQNWWIGLNYKTLNIPRMEYDFSMKYKEL